MAKMPDVDSATIDEYCFLQSGIDPYVDQQPQQKIPQEFSPEQWKDHCASVRDFFIQRKEILLHEDFHILREKIEEGHIRPSRVIQLIADYQSAAANDIQLRSALFKTASEIQHDTQFFGEEDIAEVQNLRRVHRFPEKTARIIVHPDGPWHPILEGKTRRLLAQSSNERKNGETSLTVSERFERMRARYHDILSRTLEESHAKNEPCFVIQDPDSAEHTYCPPLPFQGVSLVTSMNADTPLIHDSNFLIFLRFLKTVPLDADMRIDGFIGDQCPGTIASSYEFLQRYDLFTGRRFLNGMGKRRERNKQYEYGEPHREFLSRLWKDGKPSSHFGVIFDPTETCDGKNDSSISRYLIDQATIIISTTRHAT